MTRDANTQSDAGDPRGVNLERDEASPDTPDPLAQNAPSRPARAGSDGETLVERGGPRNPETVETPVPKAGEKPASPR